MTLAWNRNEITLFSEDNLSNNFVINVKNEIGTKLIKITALRKITHFSLIGTGVSE
jgi:hypothetical protein